MDGKFCSSGEGGTDGKDLSLCACACGSAGAWSMAMLASFDGTHIHTFHERCI